MAPSTDIAPQKFRQHHQTPHAPAMQQSSSSPATVESPTSSSMARKRTLEMSAASFEQPSIMVDPLDSSPRFVPAFDFDAVSVASSSSPYAGSVSTLDSSPMTLSNSSQSSFTSLGDDGEYESGDDASFNPRPGMKRRRTAPSLMSTPTRQEGGYTVAEKRGNGKDGQDVWPDDVEEAFHAALMIIPKLGRKKILVNSKPCGRNELIADYIRRKTGKVRTRKQVSSHIQVLKNMRKHDADFMALVSEPAEGEDNFLPENAIAFFGHPQASPFDSVPMAVSYSDGLLSPYTPTFLQRSYSMGSTPQLPHGPSSLSSSYVLAPPPLHHSQPESAPMSATSSLTHAMNDMHFPVPPNHDRSMASCPIGPSGFCMWADPSAPGDSMHVFAKLKSSTLAPAPTNTVYLEDLALANLRFPGLATMNDLLPCQFLHVKVNLDVPNNDVGAIADHLHTQLKLTSLQDLDLTSVTSIYSYGTQVLSLEEDLSAPNCIDKSLNGSANGSAHSSPTVPLSPLSAGRPESPGHSLSHKYAYDAPFASDFWSIFLRGAFSPEAPVGEVHLPSFSKSGAERSEFAMAISGLSVIQELVVRSPEPTAPLIDGREVSPGSALGDVVLVIVYDLEVKEDRSAGEVAVSFLSQKKTTPPPIPLARLPSHQLSRSSSYPESKAQTFSSPTHMAPPPPPQPQSFSHRSHHQQKPSLSLHIPPPVNFAVPHPHPHHLGAGPAPSPRSGPATPWPQVIHTPIAPPPVNAAPHSPAQRERERLEQHWARASTSTWAMESPALMGAFPPNAPYDFNAPTVSASQAMGALTASAIVVGTPALSSFQHAGQQTHGAPFMIHPSHAYAPEHEEEQSRKLMQMQQAERITGSRSPGGVSAKAPEAKEEVKKEANAQDYFSSLLGSTKYS